MDMREFSRSNMAKLLFAALCVIAIKFRNVSTDPVVNYAPWFVQNLHPDDVRAMINNNRQRIDEMNQEGLTGLMYEIRDGYPDNARVFIKEGASLDIIAKNDFVMQDAATVGRSDREESGNLRYYRCTALHMALLNANDDTNYAIAKELILGVKRYDGTIAKANVLVKNGVGYTPLHMVASAIETDDYATQDPTRNRRTELIKLLMDAAGNKDAQEGYLNAQDDEGNTMLHILAQRNALNTIEWLISTYGRMLKLDLRNKPKPANSVGKIQYPNGMTAAELARESGYGAACAGRLDVELERYNDKSISEEDYKNRPKFNDIAVPTPIYDSATAPR